MKLSVDHSVTPVKEEMFKLLLPMHTLAGLTLFGLKESYPNGSHT